MGDSTDRGAPSASSDAGVILVVNDDPLARGRVARILAEAGFAVLTAGNREDALVLARKLDGRLGLVVIGSSAQ
jgi:DNA-binding response OmpR family regulator